MNQRAQDLDLAVPAPPTRNQIEADESARPVVSGRDIAEGDTRAVHVRRVHCRARNSRARGPHRRRRARAADLEPARLALVASGVVDGDPRARVGVERNVGRRPLARAAHLPVLGEARLGGGGRLVSAAATAGPASAGLGGEAAKTIEVERRPADRDHVRRGRRVLGRQPGVA